MKTWTKAMSLVMLGLLEVVFISWIVASNLPHNRSELQAFSQYQNSPSEENKEVWLKEREKTQAEIRLRVSAGIALAAANLVIMGWIARKKTVPLGPATQ